jgi:hypothetical protein
LNCESADSLPAGEKGNVPVGAPQVKSDGDVLFLIVKMSEDSVTSLILDNDP